MSKLIDTRNKKIITAVVVLCIVITMAAVYMLSGSNKTLLKAKKEVIIEYGNKIPTDNKTFLNVEGLTKEEKKLVLKQTKLDIKDIRNETDKDYPTVGDYTVGMKYNDEIVKIKVIVKDTTLPSIGEVEEIQILQNTNVQEYDFKRLFVTTDLSEVKEPEFILDGIDTALPGEYVVQMKVKDIYENEAQQKIKVVVVPTPTETQEATEEIITNENGSIKVVINIKDKEVVKEEQETVEQEIPSNNTTTPTAQVIDLAVPYINQYAAGAPMGCEAAALLQALHYKGYASGYNLSSFLGEMPIATDGNPYHGFSNTPYEILSDEYYQSIFASPLANWGSNYGSVANISGSGIETLRNELRNGNPMVVYVTYNFETAIWQDWWFGRAVNNMHVMTLSGYDENTGKYKVTDPAGGTYWVSGSVFESRYNEQRNV